MTIIKLQNLKESDNYIHGELVVKHWTWRGPKLTLVNVFRYKNDGFYWRWTSTGDFPPGDRVVENLELAAKVEAELATAKPL